MTLALLFCTLKLSGNILMKKELRVVNLPLAVCHVHMEASLSEYRQGQFARYKNKPLPIQAHPRSYTYDMKNWSSFADPYFMICKLIDDASDFELLTRWVLEDYKAQNVIYAELIFSPDLARDNCATVIDWRDMLRAAQKAMGQAEQDGKIKVSGVVTFLRGDEKQGEDALEYVKFLIENKEELSHFRGFHLAGDEDNYSGVNQFAQAYALARENGYGCSVHAGEGGNPHSIWHALEILNPHRIGHGIAAIKDRNLMNKLIEKDIPLEICVKSNFCMGNVSTLYHHPLPALMEAGVTCLFGNPDDDRLFNTSPAHEMWTLMRLFGFTPIDILHNTRRTIEYGFLADLRKEELLNLLDSVRI